MKRFLLLFLSFVLLFCNTKASALSLSARSAVLIDALSGEIIYSYNENIKLPMASTTKIMTALILCEQQDFEREITVTKEMVEVEGSSMGLTAGGKATFRALLYGMLLCSGNDAANATALSIGKTIPDFVDLMNKRAEQLGLLNTHFDTPSGLDGDNHYTTAYDLALLARVALNNEDFATAAKAKSITIEYCGIKRTLYNHNKLLQWYDGAIGVKTGYTTKSGRCLVSAAERDGAKVIAVTLNAPDDWQDHIKLLNKGFETLKDNKQTFDEKEYTVDVHGGKNESVTAKSTCVSFKSFGQRVIKKEYIMPYVSAPVKKGEAVGYIEYYCGDSICAKEILVAQNDVETTEIATKKQLIILNFRKMLRLL